MDPSLAARFVELFDAEVANFVELELREFDAFQRFINFITRSESVISKSAAIEENRAKINTGEMELLAKEFGARWKEGLRHVSTDVLQYFSNFKTGSEILKKVFTQIVTYNARFYNLCTACFSGGNAPFRPHLVSQTEILREISSKYIVFKDEDK